MASSSLSRRTSLLATLFLALGSFACGPAELDAVPEKLLGIWKTRGARYENRFVEIHPEKFIVGVKHQDMDRIMIRAVDHRRGRDGGHEYRLHYQANEGYDDALVVRYHESFVPTVKFGEIPHLWTRVDSR
ncbi:MAG: hypothetical protein ACR2PQ_05835 [Myxococcota bacterium]